MGVDSSLLMRHFFHQKVLRFFLFLNENICCWYSFEGPQRGASNEYPQHMFSWRNKKNIIWIDLISRAVGLCNQADHRKMSCSIPVNATLTTMHILCTFIKVLVLDHIVEGLSNL